MNDSIKNLPDDPAALKKLIATLTEANSNYRNEIASYKNEIILYKEEIKILNHRLFGRRSEKCTPEEELQGRLFDEAEDASGEDDKQFDDHEVKTEVKSHARKKPGRRPLPESLPRVDVYLDLDEEDKHCACGLDKKCIGEEVSEKLDIIPAQIRVIRYIRYKYACKCEGTTDDSPAVKTAPMPPQVIPQGIVTPGLLSWSIVSKFCDALPFYRQEKMLGRIGADISRSTLCNWAILTYRACLKLLDFMWFDMKASPLVGMDETTVQVMKEPGRKNTTKSYMWIFRGGTDDSPVVMFKYNPTRGSDFINTEFADYNGIIQTDGYQGYNTLGKKETITHAACWAHVRRKFKDAEKGNNQSVAHSVLDMISKLYAVEKEIRDDDLSDEQILNLRNERSRPLIEKIKKILSKQRNHVAPKSLTGKAISYTLNLWPQLIVYLDDACIPIDNNLVENAIRPFVVGRKNWLFSGSPRGAEASAGLYSIIETAKANGLEPYWYMRYLLENLPCCTNDDELKALMPNRLSSETLAAFRGGVN